MKIKKETFQDIRTVCIINLLTCVFIKDETPVFAKWDFRITMIFLIFLTFWYYRKG